MVLVRTCVGCRQRASQSEMLRIVAQGNALVVSRNAQGRGAWLHGAKGCLDTALERKAFGRALRISTQLDTATLVATIEQAETMLAQK